MKRSSWSLCPAVRTSKTAKQKASSSRPGQGTDVFLSSSELAEVTAVIGKLSKGEGYMAYATKIDSMAPEIYKYLNFDKMEKYV